MTRLVYATGNLGKFGEVKKILAHHGLTLHSPQDLGVEIEVEESGKTLEDNARLKADAYAAALPPDCVVVGDDTGVEIEALGGEPGIYVRRWVGREMSDQEIIGHCLARLAGIPRERRTARFRTVLAVVVSGATRLFTGTLSGHIVQEPIPLRIPGFPFESLFYADEFRLMLGDMHQLPLTERLAQNILTHRERAFLKALPFLRPQVST